jgi:hypothetical protein
MKNITKRQHYVWRHYLQSWSSKDQIFTLFKDDSRIERINLMGVAQERYFYELPDLSDKEEAFLRWFVEKVGAADFREIQYDFLSKIIRIKMIKSQLKSSDLTEEMRDTLEAIRIAELNALESFHTEIEKKGLKLLSCKSYEDFKFLENKSDLFDSMIFLMFQYTRTNAMKQKFIASAEEETNRVAMNGWSILSCIVGASIARNVCLSPYLHIEILNNETGIAFLTGDQPVINVLNDMTDELGNVLEVEFYFPMTPSFALSVHLNHNLSPFLSYRTLIEKEIMYFNEKIIKNAHFFVFSDSKRQLESHVNN